MWVMFVSSGMLIFSLNKKLLREGRWRVVYGSTRDACGAKMLFYMTKH